MTEQKLKMQAPKGTSSAVIDGHEYDIPKGGVIDVVNGNHVETLKRHGFTEVDEVEDVHAKIDELGKDDKDELVRIIEEHGGDANNEMSLKKLRALAHDQVGGEE